MANEKTKKSVSLDASATWTDQNGHQWNVGAEFKEINGRLNFFAVVIKPTRGGYSITQSVLAQLPLRNLFKEVLHKETTSFNQARQTRSHQGRASSEEELKLIAEVRKKAIQENVPVQHAVAEALGISQGTAGNRIKAARAKGIIPPTGRKRLK